MEESEKPVTHVEVELFGAAHRVEPTFELIAGFEERMRSSVFNPEHWHPQPKVSAAAVLLWLAAGGRKSGRTVEDVARALTPALFLQAIAIAVMAQDQYLKAGEKKDPAA